MGSVKFKGAGRPSRCTGASQFDSADTPADQFLHWNRSGVLERFLVNVGTTTGTITVYDEVEGTTTAISVFASGLLSGAVVECGYVMNAGLTVVTSAADDITVVYNANRD